MRTHRRSPFALFVSVTALAVLALHGGAAGAQPAMSGRTPPARVAGTVFDSIARGPLPNALVQLVARSDPTRVHSVRTDTRGTFGFDSVPAGSYFVGFLNPRLDSLLLTPPLQRVDVPATGAVMVKLAVPSQRALAIALCGDGASDSTGMLLGHVRPAQPGVPARRASLRTQWSEIVIEQGMQRRLPTLLVETNRDGAFAVCGLPPDARIRVQAWTDRDTSGLVELDVPTSGLLLRDLHVGASNRVVVAEQRATGTDSVTVLRGEGRLRGTIRGPNAAPLAGARVRVRETGVEATTNASGVFTLQSLPTGTHALEASAIGYQPSRLAVDIAESGDAAVEVLLDRVGPMLDTLRVFGSRSAPFWRKDYDARRKMGVGRYIDEAVLTKRDPMTVADALDDVPAISLRPGRYSSRSLVLFRTGDTEVGYCIPNVFIDGTYRESEDGNIDELVSAREIRAIEIYRSAFVAPVVFQPRTRCGVIAIWTGMRERPPKR